MAMLLSRVVVRSLKISILIYGFSIIISSPSSSSSRNIAKNPANVNSKFQI